MYMYILYYTSCYHRILCLPNFADKLVSTKILFNSITDMADRNRPTKDAVLHIPRPHKKKNSGLATETSKDAL